MVHSTALLPLVLLAAASTSHVTASFRGRRTEVAAFQAAVFNLKPKCFIENGWDFVGWDITSVPGSVDTCCTKCEAVAGCEAWTWTDYNGGTCWLKKHGYDRKPSAGAKSALLFYEDRPKCGLIVDYDFGGNDIGNVPSPTAEGCCCICQGYAGCRAYSWSNYQGGTCWLKSYYYYNPGHVPGVKSAQAYSFEDATCTSQLVDIDFVGNDIGSQSNVRDPGRCCDICRAVDQCRAYSWTQDNGGTCYFKSRKGDTIRKAGVTSGQLWENADAPCYTSSDLDLIGPDKASLSLATVEECCTACRTRLGCRMFAWSSDNGGTCRLKAQNQDSVWKEGFKYGSIS